MLKAVMGFLRKLFSMSRDRNTAKEPDAPSTDAGRKAPGAPTRVLQPAYTLRLKPEQDEQAPDRDNGRHERAAVPLRFSWHGMTDIGRVRTHNEDSFSCLDLGGRSLFVVADGMGGHDAGEVASRIAVDTVCAEVRGAKKRAKDPDALLKDIVQRANAAVKHEGLSKGSNMGTTLGVVFVSGSEAFVANVGDSRVYWIENGSITQVTTDHSLVAKLVSAGKLTREQARNHPRSNVLYRTIGTDDAVPVDTFRVSLGKGGSLLLCTDGLWGMVPDEELRRICGAGQDPRKACDRLITMANENGGHDNITAVVVNVG